MDLRRNVARDGRALAIAALLRDGHSPAKIADALQITDEGGSVYDAMAALTVPVSADGSA